MRGKLILVLLGAGVSLIAISAIEKPPMVIYNPSPSAPVGWYTITHAKDYKTGDLVASNIPEWASNLAAERGYLPKNIPVIKTIIAGPATEFCVLDGALVVPEFEPFKVQYTDSEGRAMPVQQEGCRSLNAGEFLIGSINFDRSFDSRYFGSIRTADLIGHADFVGATE